MATSPATLETLSAPMRQVLEALLEGLPAPPDALAALSSDEKAEVAAFVRATHLIRLTLQSPLPSEEAEAASLARARAVATRLPATGNAPPATPRPALLAWLARLRGKPE